MITADARRRGWRLPRHSQTAATDFGASCLAKEIGEGLNEISAGIDADKIAEGLHLASYGNKANDTAIQNIAAMLDLYSCGRPPAPNDRRQ